MLNEEHILIQDTARRFARDSLAPIAAQLDAGANPEADRTLFLKNLHGLAELGLMGLNVRAEYGGSEAGVVAFSLAITEIARECASTAVTAQTTYTPAYSALVIHILAPLRTHSSPSRRARVFIEAGSEPAPASDKQNAPAWYSPEHNLGR